MPKLNPNRALRGNMQSLLKRSKTFLTPTGSTSNLASKNGFATAKTHSALFPATDPKVDGEDCLHDCATCTTQLPRSFSIDEDDTLYGHVKGWDTHLIVGTGKTDWVRDVTDEKGSVMEAVGKYGQEIEMSEGRGKGKVMLSASNMPTGGDHGDCDLDQGSNCILLPAWTMIDGVKPAQVPALMEEIIRTSVTNRTPVTGPKSPKDRPSSDQGSSLQNGTDEKDVPIPNLSDLQISPSPSTIQPSLLKNNPIFSTRPCPHMALILMCSHKTRDARCGQSAPLLRKEFERQLRPLGLYRDLHDQRPGGVGVYFINHVGGHKYSANVMIYRRAGRALSSSMTTTNNTSNSGDRHEMERRPEDTQQEQQQKQQQTTPSLSQEAVQGIWLARVRPEDCENIVKYTVLQGKLVKPQRQLRGGFDREICMTSW